LSPAYTILAPGSAVQSTRSSPSGPAGELNRRKAVGHEGPPLAVRWRWRPSAIGPRGSRLRTAA